MANVSVYNMEGKEVGKIDLNDAIFGVEVNEHLVHMAVLQQLADKRQGTQKAKTRSEVSGGGRKPWRQKGTGHARQGSIRAPQWKNAQIVLNNYDETSYSGVVLHDPEIPYIKSLTEAIKDNLIVVDELKFDEIKTKRFAEVMNNLKATRKALVVLADNDKNVVLSARNLAEANTTLTNTLNVYDIVNAKTLILTKDAVNKIEEVYQ